MRTSASRFLLMFDLACPYQFSPKSPILQMELDNSIFMVNAVDVILTSFIIILFTRNTFSN